MAKILDGRIVRGKIAEDLKSKILNLKSKLKLVIIQVGDLEESNSYIKQKVLFGQKIGAIVDHQKFPENVTAEKLKSKILNLNSDHSVNGIIVQLPISDHLDKNNIIDAIDPIKDVDGQTSTNIKFLFEGKTDGYTPATTKGILTLLDYYKIPIVGRHVVVIGRSSLVGKPTALALLNRNATVTICHSKTGNLKLETKNCDILVVAAGKPKLITKEHVTKGQVVIDVGINILSGFRPAEQGRTLQTLQTEKPEFEPSARKLVGDVDFEEASKIVKAISPVPGGCGPMTVASLFENLYEAYNRQVGSRSVTKN